MSCSMMKTSAVSIGSSTCVCCGNAFELLSIRHPKQRYCSQRCVRNVYSNKYPERDIESKRKYAEANKEKHAIAAEIYRKSHMGYYREYVSLRARKVQQARPKWLTEFDELFLTELYDIAVRRGLHVDHIIPISNPIVCGLHVPWNLQLLSPKENQKKNNKFNPDEDVVCVYK